jgi:hypothetical protein
MGEWTPPLDNWRHQQERLALTASDELWLSVSTAFASIEAVPRIVQTRGHEFLQEHYEATIRQIDVALAGLGVTTPERGTT